MQETGAVRRDKPTTSISAMIEPFGPCKGEGSVALTKRGTGLPSEMVNFYECNEKKRAVRNPYRAVFAFVRGPAKKQFPS